MFKVASQNTIKNFLSWLQKITALSFWLAKKQQPKNKEREQKEHKVLLVDNTVFCCGCSVFEACGKEETFFFIFLNSGASTSNYSKHDVLKNKKKVKYKSQYK